MEKCISWGCLQAQERRCLLLISSIRIRRACVELSCHRLFVDAPRAKLNINSASMQNVQGITWIVKSYPSVDFWRFRLDWQLADSLLLSSEHFIGFPQSVDLWTCQLLVADSVPPVTNGIDCWTLGCCTDSAEKGHWIDSVTYGLSQNLCMSPVLRHSFSERNRFLKRIKIWFMVIFLHVECC